MKQKIKKLIIFTLILTLTMPLAAFADIKTIAVGEPYPISVIVNDEEVDFYTYGVVPIIKDGRTILPIKAISEILGATVKYDSKTKKITIERGYNVVHMTLGSKYAAMYVNGKRSVVEMDTVPTVIDGRSYVPVKYISDAFDAYIEWDSRAYMVTITDAQKFYNDLKETEDVIIVQELDDAIEKFSSISKEYGEKLTAMRKKMEKDMNILFVAINYYEKVVASAYYGDKTEVLNLQNQIKSSSLKKKDKEELNEWIIDWLAGFDSNIEGICNELVSIAEKSMKPEDYKIAMKALGNMPYNTSKQSFMTRLNKISVEIQLIERYQDAEAKIQSYIKNQTRSNLDAAKNAVNNLPSGVEKSSMLNRLKEYENQLNIIEAETAVKIAELSKQIDNYITAKSKVNALVSSDGRTALNKRLNAIEILVYEVLQIEATQAVSAVENTRTVPNYDYAKLLVSKMPSSTLKSTLSNRLEVVKVIIDAEILVIKAESTKAQEDISKALTYVDKYIKTESLRNSYAVRLSNLQSGIDANLLDLATKAVVKAEISLIKPDYTAALELVKILKTSQAKTALENRLVALLPLVKENYAIYVKGLVDYAVVNPTLEAYSAAFNANKDVSDSSKRGEFSSTLAGVYRVIMNAQVQAAGVLVSKAEVSLLQIDLDIARVAVNKLPDSPEKHTQTEALNTLQLKINTKTP